MKTKEISETINELGGALDSLNSARESFSDFSSDERVDFIIDAQIEISKAIKRLAEKL